MSSPTIDIHAHALAANVDALVADHPDHHAALAHSLVQFGEASQLHNLQMLNQTWHEQLSSLDARVAAMDASGIDVQAVSPSPTQYHYWADENLAGDIVETTNQSIAALVAQAPDRLVGLGSVALQHPDLAAEQVVRAVDVHGLKGVEISSHAGDRDFSDAAYEPFWAAAAQSGAVLFLHPLGCTLDARLTPFYLGNVIGQPLETTIALSHLIFSGVLDRHPDLRVVAAHGGGYLPQYCGRSDHAWHVRPESRTCAEPPSHYLQRLWFDSLVYDPSTLASLVGAVGGDRVVLGTDYPFDMGVTNPIERVHALADHTNPQSEAILGANAARLLNIPLRSTP